MKNLKTYSEFQIETQLQILESYLENDDFVLEYTEKDTMRIKDLFKRAKGQEDKVLQLAQKMANSIKDVDKAIARAEAAEFALGKSGERTPNAISNIFYARAKELGASDNDISNTKSTPKVATVNKPNDYTIKNGRGGVIFLPSWEAIALWKGYLLGQFSDGFWENAKPYDHWKFWSALEVKLGRPEVQRTGLYPSKKSYNLMGPYQYVEDETLAIGRMARAIGEMDDNQIAAAQYMPKTLEEFEWGKKVGKWNPGFIGDHMKSISLSNAKKYYATTFTEKDVKKVLKDIKLAMQTA